MQQQKSPFVPSKSDHKIDLIMDIIMTCTIFFASLFFIAGVSIEKDYPISVYSVLFMVPMAVYIITTSNAFHRFIVGYAIFSTKPISIDDIINNYNPKKERSFIYNLLSFKAKYSVHELALTACVFFVIYRCFDTEYGVIVTPLMCVGYICVLLGHLAVVRYKNKQVLFSR